MTKLAAYAELLESFGNLGMLLPLGATSPLDDLSSNNRDGTAAGGITTGGVAGPWAYEDDGATDFDGTDDRITTTYATRRNYILNPSFEVDANNYSQGGSSRTNLIPNPSLETGITGWSALAGSSVWSTDAFMFGANAFKSVSTGSSNRVYSGPIADATAGTTYTASGYGRTEESGRTGKVMIRFFDSGGTILQSTDGTTSSYTASTWQRFSVTATAPAGTAKVGMALYWDAGGTASSGQVCYADGFLIETGSSLLTYFPDGTQLADPNIGITWAGTAHASASTWAMKVTRTSAESVTGSYSGYVTTNGQSSNGISAFSSGAPLPAGKTWTASCYVKADTSAIGQTLRFSLTERHAGSTVGTSFTELVLTGDWQRVGVTRTFTTGTDFWAYATLSGAPAAFWVDGYMFEEGSSVGSVFPGATQLASGEAGWTGTPHASYSDIGCFANGTSRTFMGWAKADTLTETRVLFAAGAFGPQLYLNTGTGNVLFTPAAGGTTTTWTGAWPGIDQWAHWAVVFDESANQASLYINGALVSTQTNAQAYNASPGNLTIGQYGVSHWNGAQALFSVHERALTADQIVQAFAFTNAVPGAADSRPSPKSNIRVITTNPTGGGYDITDLIDGLSWSSTNPGGDERATFTFKRSWFASNPEIAKGSLVRIEDGLQRLWTGRIEERSRGTNTTEEITVTCYGLGNRIKDNLMSMIYVDRDLSGWADPSRQRRYDILSGGYTEALGPTVQADTTNGLPALAQIVGSASGNTLSEAWYDAGQDNLLGSVYCDYTSHSVAALQCVLASADTDNASGLTGRTVDLITGTDSSGTFTVPVGQRYLFFLFVVGTTGSQDRDFTCRKLAVYGDHGLTKRGTSGAEGFYDSDIVSHVISQIPTVDARTIDTGSSVITQAAYKDKVTPEQIITDAAQYENRDWGTWGSDNLFGTDSAVFDYKLKDTATRHWTVSRADAEDLDLADELAGLFDTAVIKYTDESGTSRSVTRTATITELVNAGLSPKTVEINGGTLTQAAAQTLGDTALAFFGGFAPARGSLTLKGNASHYQRGDIPAHFMRADGSNIQVRDILPSTTALALDSTPDRRSTFPIKRVSVDCSGAVPVTTVDLDQSNDRLTQLQARLGVTATSVLG